MFHFLDLNVRSDYEQSCGHVLKISSITLTFIYISTVIILFTILLILVRAKWKLSLELRRVQIIQTHGLYEEIDNTPRDRPTVINTQENISYATASVLPINKGAN